MGKTGGGRRLKGRECREQFPAGFTATSLLLFEFCGEFKVWLIGSLKVIFSGNAELPWCWLATSEIFGFSRAREHSVGREGGRKGLGASCKGDLICWFRETRVVAVCTGCQEDAYFKVSLALELARPSLGLCSTTEKSCISTPPSFHLTPCHPLEECEKFVN